MGRIRRELASTLKPVIRRHSAWVGSIVEVTTTAPEVVLSYDDGPEPGGTDQVLQALAEYQATATFFVLLSRVRAHPEMVLEIVAAGHEIGLHGLNHERLTQLPASEVRRRTASGKKELEDLTGQPIRWFRPPYGRQLPSTWLAIRAAGLESVCWGPSSADSQHLPQNEQLERALSNTKAGDILLCHDGFATARDGVDDGPAPAVNRLELNRGILAGLESRGLHGVSLGNALHPGTAFRAAWFKR